MAKRDLRTQIREWKQLKYWNSLSLAKKTEKANEIKGIACNKRCLRLGNARNNNKAGTWALGSHYNGKGSWDYVQIAKAPP